MPNSPTRPLSSSEIATAMSFQNWCKHVFNPHSEPPVFEAHVSFDMDGSSLINRGRMLIEVDDGPQPAYIVWSLERQRRLVTSSISLETALMSAAQWALAADFVNHHQPA
jgi:hypothetical protein